MRWIVFAVLASGFVFGATPTLHAKERYKTINIENSSRVTPEAINKNGDLTGDYVNSNGILRGFTYAHDGTVATFDVTSEIGTLSTLPTGINASGEVTGGYVTTDGEHFHSFVRDDAGSIIAFDVPNGAESTGVGIDSQGTVTGLYIDHGGINHIFQRTKRGKFKTLDAPGAGQKKLQGTWPSGVTAAGSIVGYYQDTDGIYHGFMRGADKTYATFDAPGAGTKPNQGTYGTGINDAGDSVGYVVDSHNALRGFIRTNGGIVTVFDVPGSTATVAMGIGATGETVGYYIDAQTGKTFGFVRSASGDFEMLDGKGTNPGGGNTTIYAINAKGLIAGTYSLGVAIHGFILHR